MWRMVIPLRVHTIISLWSTGTIMSIISQPWWKVPVWCIAIFTKVSIIGRWSTYFSTIILTFCWWWLFLPIQYYAKKTLKNDRNHGLWVFIWEYSARVFQWIPTWQGSNDFQFFLHFSPMNESSLSMERVKTVSVVLGTVTLSCM